MVFIIILFIFGLFYFQIDSYQYKFSYDVIRIAKLFVFLSFILFVLGFYFAYKIKDLTPIYLNVEISTIDKGYFVISYILLLIGICATIYSATYSTSIADYLKIVENGTQSNLRASYELSSDEGGISGLIKIWAYGIVAIFMSSSFLYIFSKKQNRKIKTLLIISTFAMLVRVVFTLENTTLVALVTILFIILLAKRKILLIVFLFIGFPSIFNFIIQLRIPDWNLYLLMQHYTENSVNNFLLLIKTFKDFDYGISSVLNIIPFIFNYLGYNIKYSIFDWEINPAQNILGDTYLNFHFMGIFEYLIYGLMFGRLLVLLKKKHFKYGCLGLNILYLVVSFISVPIFKGIEFWFSIVIQLTLFNRYVKLNRHEDNF